MQAEKDLTKLRHPGTGMGGYLGYAWGSRSVNNILWWDPLMRPSFQAAQIRYVSSHSQVEWLCPSKADKGCRPGAILGLHQLINFGYYQVEWSVLKLQWVAKELLIRNGANLQVSSRKMH